jgi:2-polyprenyl-3-methyl-5-hydroxy-6-metoxy-1,4-benzoquinol methylase
MNQRYWDQAARAWDQHIMCSLHENAGGHIARLLSRLSRRHRSILDYGCGVGGYLPLLSARFARVTAVDSSRACVRKAAALARGLPNVQVQPASELPRRGGGKFDAVLLANVLIHPSEPIRAAILRHAAAQLRRNGSLVMVVPAVESVHLAEAQRRAHTRARASAYAAAKAAPYEPGVIAIHGRATKHYSASEIPLFLARHGLEDARVQAAYYSWSSEGFPALDRRTRSRPWDWLVSATKG